MLPNEFFNICRSKTGHFAKADAGQPGLLTGDVVVDPSFADAQPCGNFCNREEGFEMSSRLVVQGFIRLAL
jgi:hypothetical protein